MSHDEFYVGHLTIMTQSKSKLGEKVKRKPREHTTNEKFALKGI